MSWLLWLSGPVVAAAAASVWAWWLGFRERPRRTPGTVRSVKAHGKYLRVLDHATASAADRARPNG
ncbi:MAG: hypothetical protein ACTHMS_18290 [Jatrophihabitans sp.]|uniref:hypothetical protein n=1 Tax=Jatrophihabitans sp. TaxID=1932789 RepID=UPI003F7E56B6